MKSFFMYNVVIALSLFSIACSNIADPVGDTTQIPLIVQSIPTETNIHMDNTENTDADNLKKREPQRSTIPVFRDLLLKLKLTDEQKPIVDKFLTGYTSCINQCRSALKAAEREILTNARITEEQIKKDLDAGVISKSESREKRAALRKAVNEQLKNIPIRNNVKECMQSCDAAFIKNLEPILNPDQLQILKQWIELKRKHGR